MLPVLRPALLALCLFAAPVVAETGPVACASPTVEASMTVPQQPDAARRLGFFNLDTKPLPQSLWAARSLRSASTLTEAAGFPRLHLSGPMSLPAGAAACPVS